MALSICNKYGLDPLLKHVVLIGGNAKDERGGYIKKYTVYITRDGLLHVAHSSGNLDGMRTSLWQDDLGVWAECTVYRKDMTHEFSYKVYMDEYKANTQVWQKYAKSMLIKVAEVFTLRRAFDVAITPIEEMGFENTGFVVDQEPVKERSAPRLVTKADPITVEVVNDGSYDPGEYHISFKTFTGKIREMSNKQIEWLAYEYTGKDKKAQQCAKDYLLMTAAPLAVVQQPTQELAATNEATD